MAYRIVRKLWFSFVLVLFFLIIGLSFSYGGNKRGPIIIGIGGGYSLFLDSGLKNFEVYHPKLISFSEQLNLRNNFFLYAQYFPWRGFGFQLEFDHQKADYRSDLKWYGQPTSEGRIIEINHIEEPYKVTWNFSSIAASVVYALTLDQNAKIRPYVTAGFGYYFSSGDEERFYHRTRLGPQKSGNLVKLGLGVKYRVSPKIGINIRGVGGTFWRREYGFGDTNYVGPEQFVYDVYIKTGKIVRVEKALVNSFTYLGISLGLEYTF